MAELPSADAVQTRRLLDLARSGDQEAWERLCGDHRAWLVKEARGHRALRPLRGEATVEDLVQEVFRRVLAQGLLTGFQYRGPGSLRRFLWKVFDRTVHDFLRRASAAKRAANTLSISGDESRGDGARPRAVPQVLSNEPTPTSSARAAEMKELVHDLVTEDEWRVFEMVRLEGRTSGETARTLGKAPGTVRWLLSRATGKLRDFFESQGWEFGP